MGAAALALYLPGRRYDHTITQRDIDRALQARFPVSKTHYLIFKVTYSNPQVRLLPDSNRVEVGLDAVLDIKVPGRPVSLGSRAIATTGIAYRSETQQFFLSDPQLSNLTFQGIPPEGADAAGRLVEAASDKLKVWGVTEEQLAEIRAFAAGLASEQLQRYPIYTIKATDAKSRAAKLMLKDVEVRSNEIHVTLGL